VRELLSHAMPGASVGELIERLAKDFVSRHDPLLRAESKKRSEFVAQNETPPRETASVLQCETTGVKRAISTVLRRCVIRRAGGQCEYTHQGRRCSSRFQLEASAAVTIK